MNRNLKRVLSLALTMVVMAVNFVIPAMASDTITVHYTDLLDYGSLTGRQGELYYDTSPNGIDNPQSSYDSAYAPLEVWKHSTRHSLNMKVSEWIRFEVHIPATGFYSVAVDYGCGASAGAEFIIRTEHSIIETHLPKSGQNAYEFTTVSDLGYVYLEEGSNYVYVDNKSASAYINFRSLSLTLEGTADATMVTWLAPVESANEIADYTVAYTDGYNQAAVESVTFDMNIPVDGKYKVSLMGKASSAGEVSVDFGDDAKTASVSSTDYAYTEIGVFPITEGAYTLTLDSFTDYSLAWVAVEYVSPYATVIESVSFVDGDTVARGTDNLTIRFNDNMMDTATAILTADDTEIPVDVTVDGANVVVSFLETLDYETEYTLTVSGLQGVNDDAALEDIAYTFTTDDETNTTGDDAVTVTDVNSYREAVTITGTVLGSTGKGIKGRTVTVTDSDGADVVTVISGDNGAFTAEFTIADGTDAGAYPYTVTAEYGATTNAVVSYVSEAEELRILDLFLTATTPDAVYTIFENYADILLVPSYATDCASLAHDDLFLAHFIGKDFTTVSEVAPFYNKMLAMEGLNQETLVSVIFSNYLNNAATLDLIGLSSGKIALLNTSAKKISFANKIAADTAANGPSTSYEAFLARMERLSDDWLLEEYAIDPTYLDLVDTTGFCYYGNEIAIPLKFADSQTKVKSIEVSISTDAEELLRNAHAVIPGLAPVTGEVLGDTATFTIEFDYDETAVYDDLGNIFLQASVVGAHHIYVYATVTYRLTAGANYVDMPINIGGGTCIAVVEPVRPPSGSGGGGGAVAFTYTCGESVTATLNENSGVLTISGTGAMYDYLCRDDVPWYEDRALVKEVIIEDGVTSIGDYAFDDCYNLTSVEIPDSVTTIGGFAFSGCYSLMGVEIPDSVTTIGESAFGYCDDLTSVEIPDSVTTIGYSAFAECESLTSVTIGNGVTTIEDCVFTKCSNLTDVYYNGTQVQWDQISIGHSNGDLTDATIHFALIDYQCGENIVATLEKNNGVLTVRGTGAMYDYTWTSYAPWYKDRSLVKKVIVEDGITSIGKTTFYECSNLKDVEISDSVTNISGYAFYHCTGLRSVTVGNRIIAIGEYAFGYCTGLRNITIPNTVTGIVYYAFSGCSNLTDVYYNGAREQWNQISVGLYNEPLTNATFHYFAKVTVLNEDGTEYATWTQPMETVFEMENVPNREGFVLQLYQDAQLTQVFESDTIIREDTVIYLRLLSRGVFVFGAQSAEIGSTDVVQSVFLATGDDASILYCYITYPDDIVLTNVVAKDFGYALLEDQWEEDGVVTSVILAQYSDNDWIPKDVELNPFDLVFDVPKNAAVQTVEIAVTQDSFLVGNDVYYPNIESPKLLEILPKLAESVIISGDDEISGVSQYSAVVFPDYTTNKEIVWSVDNEDVATIDQNGIVTSVTSGTVVITATVNDGSGVYATKEVTIIKLAESIEIVGDREIFEPTQYTVNVLPDYTTNKEVIWSISDESLATVDENGVVTPLKNGTVVLTVTATDGSGLTTTHSIVISVSVRANSITTDIGFWDAEFDPDITEYTVYVAQNTTAIYFTSSFQDATLKLNGSPAANGVRKKVSVSGDTTQVIMELNPMSANNLKANTYTINVVKCEGVQASLSKDNKQLRVEPVGIEEGCSVLVASYANGVLCEVQPAIYEGETLYFDVNQNCTDVKVMAWQTLDNLKSLCNAKAILIP